MNSIVTPAERDALLEPIQEERMKHDVNEGHGHVFPRPDGILARCGGPSLCSICAKDLARKNGTPVVDMTDPVDAVRAIRKLMTDRTVLLSALKDFMCAEVMNLVVNGHLLTAVERSEITAELLVKLPSLYDNARIAIINAESK